MSENQLPVFETHPYLWGNPDTPGQLPKAAAEALAGLGATPPGDPVPPESAELPGVSLPDDVREELVAVLGEAHLSSDHQTRVLHTRGYSTPDLLRLRAGDGSDAPDAVAFPADHEQVQRVLEICSAHRVAVVPFAGGTSVVGGLTPLREGYAGVLALDPRRLDALLTLDTESRTAVLQSGLRGTRAEALLNEQGFTLGHFPQSYESATIGGYAAARSAGQSSAGYGRFDEMVVGLTLAAPAGSLRLGTADKSAAGPDLRQLVLGSEGAFGVITDVTVRVHPLPEKRVFTGWRFESFAAGAAALRALAQDGPLPTVLRLSDETETMVNLADPNADEQGSGGALAIAGFEGAPDEVDARRAAAERVLAEHGRALGEEQGEAWRTGRYRGPYLRDQLFAAGALVETLETATFWSHLHEVKAAVTAAIEEALSAQRTSGLVMCHVSHVYPTGASLYFTVVAKAADDPLAQWARCKQAANRAIRAGGATISHHHGVGTDHREVFAEEIGPLGVGVLQAVKGTLDPNWVLNPGVLVALR